MFGFITKTWLSIAALLILSIAATMFFVLQGEDLTQDQEKAVHKPITNQIQVLASTHETSTPNPGPDALAKDFSLPHVIPENHDQEQVVAENAKDPVMKWPGQGEIISEFGFGYSETFNDLRFHPGIDIALPPGYEVRAALAGTVVSISSTPMWGYEIVIKHGDKLETRYKGVKPIKEKGGYQVEKGDVIGQVIHSPKYEAKMNPHLHFEVYEYGQAVDPMKYL